MHETIDYDFGDVPHHGIYRDVPVRTDQSGKDGYDRVYPLDVVSVTGSPGTPAQYTVDDEGDDQRIKIGDPDETITGEHTYDITYRVRGAMNAFADHDELVWNAVGTDWSVPIEQATAVVHAPADIQRVAVRDGALRVVRCRAPTASSTGDRRRRSRETQLAPYSGMTFSDRDPEGRGRAGADADPGGAVQLRLGVPGDAQHRRHLRRRCSRCSPAIVIFLVWKFGRDRRYAGSAVDAAYGEGRRHPRCSAPLREAETPVEFVPPDDLRPGELGHAHRLRGGHARRDRHHHRPRGARLPQDRGGREGVVPVQARLDAHQVAQGRRAAPLRAHAVRRAVPRRRRGQALGPQEHVRRRA